MVKRIYALSIAHSRFSAGRSRFLNSAYWVLGIMVTAFIAKYAVSVTFLLLATGPNSGIYGESRSQRLIASHYQNDPAVEGQFLNVYVCGIYPLPTGFMMAPQYSALVFETLLLALAVGYFISDALQSRCLAGPKMWKVNDIVRVLVMDSTIYFAVYVWQWTNRLPNLIHIFQYDFGGRVGYCEFTTSSKRE